MNQTKMTKDGRLVLVGGTPATIPAFVIEGKGRCRSVGDPDDFTEDTLRISGYVRRANAYAVCAGCPFSGECLADGIARQLSGVFGGEWLRDGVMQEKERKVRRRAA